MGTAAEPVSLEKEAPSRSPETSAPQSGPALSGPAFDPFVERLFNSAPAEPPDSAAGSLSIQRLKAPVLQRAQRLYGNRATQQMVRRARVLQRQCKCGGTCAKCQEEEEQRALQRSSAAGTPAEFDGIPTTGGEPLNAATRRPLEAHFGADLADVRVHSGPEAADSASKLDALAYTSGRDIYFAPGMYAPASDSGRRLLAHEVAHVVQQGSGKEPIIATKSTRGVKIGAPDDILETEADQAAEAFMSGTPLTDEEQRKKREAGSAVQRFIQRQDDGGAPAPAPAPSDATPAPASVPAAPSVAELRQRYEAALANARATGDWQDAAEKLNIFNHEDIQNYLAQLSDSEIGYLHQGALDNSRLGPDSAAAQLTALGTPRASTLPPRTPTATTAAPSREQRLLDLLDGNDWKTFFTEFSAMSEAEQLKFLRDNFGAVAKISTHIGSAEWGGDRDRIRYLLLRATTPASTSLYVDASVHTYRWQPKYRVENPLEFSRFISFGDAFSVEIDINTIGDGELSEDAAEKQFQEAQPGPGGFLWPAIRNRSTLPVLWQVKQDVRKQMETLLFDPVLKAGIMVVQYLLNVLFPVIQGAAIRSLAALRGTSLAGRWLQGANVVKGPAAKVMTDAEAFTQARNARNTMVDAFNQMPKAQREQVAAVTGGVNVETGQVAGGYNTAGRCAEDMVVERLGGDASKVKFSEAVRPRTGQQQPVCLGCQGKYAKEQFPERSTIFGGPGVTMPGAGQ